ncbi:Zinc finger protein 865 [Amphibalanus amphitrite]|uniref:Zinc finger protein 865 n=1 Tax=Amphibalanus amphitrite TaxID=1232801 RepID=A0A6A4W5A9_AMPAM|nr:Zinc finger protein 865 [Amphibalanus amphitrite]KAF0297062.1 Zinc finger protein 865 [Amphibalanus amphitrite]
MSGSLSTGRRRKKRRQRQRPAGGEENPLNLSLPLEVEVRESAWYPSGERSSKLDAAAAAAELSPDSRDDASQSEFLCVRAALEEQTDLGLHINEKGNQICQLRWADFSQRVPSHWTERHPNVCPLCKKKLSSRFSLSRHYIDVHHREEKKLPTPAPCRFCSKILYNQSTLNRHVLTVHKEEALALAAAVGTGRGAAAAPAAAPAADPSPPPAPLSTGYYCALCQQRHRRKSEVTRHMQLLKLQSPMGATRTGQAPKIQSPRAGRSSTAARQASAGE